MELFAQGKVDAFLGFPPEPQELRARKFGHVILNTTTEKPWSQYYCCMVVGQKEFVHHHPVATKRVVRALLKANDSCAAEPERAAQQLVDRGFAGRYDYALETVTAIPMPSGETSTLRIRCGSTRFASTRSAQSSPARTRSSPRAPTGAS
jgi:NitT/TauT family transport system substrate-binding protein